MPVSENSKKLTLEIGRCKECKFFLNYGDVFNCNLHLIMKRPEGFCDSFEERKKQEKKLKVGKKYKTSNFFEVTNANTLIGTEYEYEEIIVRIEKLDVDEDYCMVIVDKEGRIIKRNKLGIDDNFFFLNDDKIEKYGAYFEEYEE